MGARNDLAGIRKQKISQNKCNKQTNSRVESFQPPYPETIENKVHRKSSVAQIFQKKSSTETT